MANFEQRLRGRYETIIIFMSGSIRPLMPDTALQKIWLFLNNGLSLTGVLLSRQTSDSAHCLVVNVVNSPDHLLLAFKGPVKVYHLRHFRDGVDV